MTAANFRLGCLHMHHSNIAYIDGIVTPDHVEVLHFVDPGLIRRIGSDSSFTRDQAEGAGATTTGLDGELRVGRNLDHLYELHRHAGGRAARSDDPGH